MYGEGADPDAGNVRNETPLMFAAGNGHLEIVSWLTDTEGANYTAASIPGNYKSHLIVHGDASFRGVGSMFTQFSMHHSHHYQIIFIPIYLALG